MFFLDKHVIDIAKLAGKPLDAETELMQNVIWFTPDGKLYYSNSYFLVEYIMPTEADLEETSSQLALFENKPKFKESFLSKPVGVLGKEFAHTCDFKSGMPDVGEYAVIVEAFGEKEPSVEIFWSSGVSEKTTKHLIQSGLKMPPYEEFINKPVPHGSKLLVDTDYLKTLSALCQKVAKSRGLEPEVMIELDNPKNMIRMSCECLKVVIMGRKSEN